MSTPPKRAVVVDTCGEVVILLSPCRCNRAGEITSGRVVNGAWDLSRDPVSGAFWSTGYPNRKTCGYAFYKVPEDVKDVWAWGAAKYKELHP